MKLIPLTKGQAAILDDEDFQLLGRYKWRAVLDRKSQQFRAATTLYARGGHRNYRYTNVQMHRLIMGALPGEFIDHRNHNPLDNRRSNLRICTRAENNRNRHAMRSIGSKFKGVSPHHSGKFRARICVERKAIHLGLYRSEIEAAVAYDAAALKFHGAFALLNFT